MREIKFRAWDEYLKEMYELEKVNYLGSTGILDTCVGCDKAVWMQYTGLKDKNGVEIYEGDIIGNPNNKEKDNWYVSHHVVEWFDTGFVGKQLCSSGRIGLEYWTRGENGYVVIGNIYETPELLQEGK